MWVTPAARYTWFFQFYVQSSMPPNPSLDKLREADSPAKGFLSVLCAWDASGGDSFDYLCYHSNAGVHLSSIWDINTDQDSCKGCRVPVGFMCSFMLKLGKVIEIGLGDCVRVVSLWCKQRKGKCVSRRNTKLPLLSSGFSGCLQ